MNSTTPTTVPPIDLLFVTGNSYKLEAARSALTQLGAHEINVLQYDRSYDEIQADDVRDVAKHKAELAHRDAGMRVAVSDVAFMIDSLNGFPGPYVKFVNRSLSAEQLAALVAAAPTNDASFVDIIAVASTDGAVSIFEDVTSGTMLSAVPPGVQGGASAVDSLFVPQGFRKPLALLSEPEQMEVWGTGAWGSVVQWLSTQARP